MMVSYSDDCWLALSGVIKMLNDKRQEAYLELWDNGTGDGVNTDDDNGNNSPGE